MRPIAMGFGTPQARGCGSWSSRPSGGPGGFSRSRSWVWGAAILVYERRLVRLRRAHAAQAAFSRQLIGLQEGERKTIAAELHDGLGQSLLIIKNRALLGLTRPEDQTVALTQLNEIS